MHPVLAERLERELKIYPGREDQVLREVLQETTLWALTQTDFFTKAAFLGGTSLRLLHRLDRFSEDLDFSLIKSDETFSLKKYSDAVQRELEKWGLSAELKLKHREKSPVEALWVKESVLAALVLHSPAGRKIRVKLEIDKNPPEGAQIERCDIKFPITAGVTAYNLSSAMAGKLHAVLARPYPVGRDWYDLVWYIDRNVSPNLTFLNNALKQIPATNGEQNVESQKNLQDALIGRLESIKIEKIKQDLQDLVHERSFVNEWDQSYLARKIEEIEVPQS